MPLKNGGCYKEEKSLEKVITRPNFHLPLVSKALNRRASHTKLILEEPSIKMVRIMLVMQNFTMPRRTVHELKIVFLVT